MGEGSPLAKRYCLVFAVVCLGRGQCLGGAASGDAGLLPSGQLGLGAHTRVHVGHTHVCICARLCRLWATLLAG